MTTIRAIVSVLAGVAVLTAAARQGTTFHVTRTIPVGLDGGWDYVTFDPDGDRLFVSRGGAAVVQVVDLKSGLVAGTIDSTRGVHGIALAPELGRGFTSNGADSTVTIFDLKSLKQLAKVTVTGRNPDAILYDPYSKRVFTFNHTGHNTTAIDAATGKVLGTAKTNGTLEAGQSDLAGNIYVNDEEGSRLFVVDAKTLDVKATWPMTGCTAPTGLAIDRTHKRLFASCNESQTMAVVDYTTGRTVATPAICRGADAAAFDNGLQLAFASCGDGNITVIHEDSPDKYTVVGNAATEARARTMTIDEKTHTLYTVTAQFNAQTPPPAGGGRGRATMVPGSFRVLVLGR